MTETTRPWLPLGFVPCAECGSVWVAYWDDAEVEGGILCDACKRRFLDKPQIDESERKEVK